jgi:shikimate kinase
MKINKHIVLCGMPGSGKSTVGRLLSEYLDLPFVDLDAFIEVEEKSSIPQIFSTRGEAAFREMELRYLSLALKKCPSIIALGGGALSSRQLLDLVLANSFPVYLSVELQVLIERLKNERHDRPLLNMDNWEKRLEELEGRRKPIFEQLEIRVDGGEDPKTVIEHIVKQLDKHGD